MKYGAECGNIIFHFYDVLLTRLDTSGLTLLEANFELISPGDAASKSILTSDPLSSFSATSNSSTPASSSMILTKLGYVTFL